MGETREKRVLVFPAVIEEEPPDKKLYFLFSVLQVEDIIKDMEISILKVPFSPPYVGGLTLWRNIILPVISLETCLGFTAGTSTDLRYISVRIHNEESEKSEMRTMLQVSSAIKMLTFPIDCSPVSSFDFIPRKHLVKGVYEWEKGYLVVGDMQTILMGNIYNKNQA